MIKIFGYMAVVLVVVFCYYINKKNPHHDIIDLSIWILNTKVSIKLLISNENMINEINFFSSCLLEIVIQKNINKTFPTILFLYMYNE